MAFAKEPSPKVTGLCSPHSPVGGEAEAALPLGPASGICSDPVLRAPLGGGSHCWGVDSFQSESWNPVRQTGSRMFPVALESGPLREAVILWETGLDVAPNSSAKAPETIRTKPLSLDTTRRFPNWFLIASEPSFQMNFLRRLQTHNRLSHTALAEAGDEKELFAPKPLPP